jgi:pyruvate formate lyase activating enzyme
MSRGLVFDIDTFAVHDGPGIRLAVYLKGCPLECAWCHSPESQRPEPELAYIDGRCTRCGACVEVCPEGVHEISSDRHTLDRSRCTACGACVAECPSGALEIKGFWVEAADVAARAARMKPFFAHSGGGLTITGGEVTSQPEFAMELLQRCRDSGIHTAIETCGVCDWSNLRALAELSDIVYYDLKLADPELHRKWTGADNRVILQNLKALGNMRLSGGRKPTVVIRVPLIPEITDSKDNLEAIGNIADEIGIERIERLPYNETAAAKYEWLGRRFTLPVSVR